MRSPFRPSKPPDPDILDNHRDRIRLLQRRGIIRGGLSLGALALLTGCDVTSDPSIDKGLRQISKWNDRVQAALFDPNHLAPTYPASMILRPPKINAYYAQLGEGLLEYVGPLVETRVQEKPLSIAMREISERLITAEATEPPAV